MCGHIHPATTAVLFARAPNPIPVRTPIDSYSVEVPACWRCALRLHLTRLGRPIFLYTLFFVGLLYVFTRSVPTRSSISIVGLIVTIAAAALAGIHHLFPPPFSVDPGPNSVLFTFRDLSLGYEFRAMNPEAREAGDLTSA